MIKLTTAEFVVYSLIGATSLILTQASEPYLRVLGMLAAVFVFFYVGTYKTVNSSSSSTPRGSEVNARSDVKGLS